MKEIIINSKKHGQKVVMVDSEDYKWLTTFKWSVVKDRNTFYACRHDYTNGGKKVLMHRLILGITNPKVFVDHADKNGLNNCRNNIRIATCSQNCANRNSRKNTTSKYKGVHWDNHKKRWRATVTKNNIDKHAGYFSIESDAAIAYNKKAIEIHGSFASLNTI
jgi:hypothetical protein